MGVLHFIIYRLTHKTNGKVYIGVTRSSLEQRLAQHRSRAKRGGRFAIHAAIRKHGLESFTTAVIAERDGLESALETEIRLIAEHDCVAPRGYNMTCGGEGMIGMTELSKRQHRDALKRAWQDPVKRSVFMAAAARPERRTRQSVSIRKALLRPATIARKVAAMSSRDYSLKMSAAVRTADVQARRRASMLANGTAKLIQCVQTGRVFFGSLDAQAWVRSNHNPKALQCAILKACKKCWQAYGFNWRFVTREDCVDEAAIRSGIG